jgi:ATP-dependent helicase/nuclease subunit B
LDSSEPVEVRLPGGRTIRARGRVDRVDRLPGGALFGIVDYKTGSSKRYEGADPFSQGRHVQNALYVAMVGERLRQVLGKDAAVAKFGYFFPSPAEMGRRIEWPAEKLRAGLGVVERLVEMIAAGCFPLSDDKRDLQFSDYAAVLGDAEEGARATKRKLAGPGNAALESFRSLREGAASAAQDAPPPASAAEPPSKGKPAPKGRRAKR